MHALAYPSDIESAEAMRRAAEHAAAFELNDDLDPAKRNSILYAYAYAYVDGCSHAEILVRLESPLGTVQALIKRGLQALKECMT